MLRPFGKIILPVSLCLLIISAGLLMVDSHRLLAGALLSLSFALTGLSMLQNPLLKSTAFTFFIFAAVSCALFFPDYFVQLGDFSLKQLIIPLLMLIMFGMGCSMNWRDFAAVVQSPKAVLIGVMCQFSLMPLIGATLAFTSGLPPEIAAGIILVGCSPSGLASNVMSYISGANLALSLTLTAVATLLAPIMTPMLMAIFADQYVPINATAMFLSIVKIVILPIIAGVIFNQLFKHNLKLINQVMPVVSMAGIAFIIAIITAAGRDALLTIGMALILIVTIHNVMGYVLGYGIARLSGLDESSARTVSFEVGMQNSGLASGIAVEMGKVATMGLAPAVFGPFMNITGSALAAWWRNKPIEEDLTVNQETP